MTPDISAILHDSLQAGDDDARTALIPMGSREAYLDFVSAWKQRLRELEGDIRRTKRERYTSAQAASKLSPSHDGRDYWAAQSTLSGAEFKLRMYREQANEMLTLRRLGKIASAAARRASRTPAAEAVGG